MPKTSKVPIPHDAYTKALLDEPGHMDALVADHLPAALKKRIKKGAVPEALDGNFIDPSLRQSQSDRLYRIALKRGGHAYIYVLIEHKSSPDRRIFQQLLRYQLGIWEKYGDQNDKPPLIFPLVIYHGKEPWNIPESLDEMTEDSEALRPYGLQYRYCLLDLGHIPFRKMSSSSTLRAGFVALWGTSWLEEGEGKAELAAILRELEGSGLAIRTVEYILHEWPISEEEYQAALDEVNSETAEEIVETIAQIYEKRYKAKGLAEGLAEGLAQGMAQGKAQGKATMVERLLQRQFGPLSPTAQSRIGQASAEELDAWFDRAIGASSLNAVFGNEDPH